MSTSTSLDRTRKRERQARRRLAKARMRLAHCVYCGAAVSGTVDHIRPKVRGGTGNIWNLAPACATCNHFKDGLLLTELAAARPDLVLHAVLVSGVVRAEWLRLTMPSDLRRCFRRVTGTATGTPLIRPAHVPAVPPRRATEPNSPPWQRALRAHRARGMRRHIAELHAPPLPKLPARITVPSDPATSAA